MYFDPGEMIVVDQGDFDGIYHKTFDYTRSRDATSQLYANEAYHQNGDLLKEDVHKCTKIADDSCIVTHGQPRTFGICADKLCVVVSIHRFDRVMAAGCRTCELQNQVCETSAVSKLRMVCALTEAAMLCEIYNPSAFVHSLFAIFTAYNA